MSERIPKVISVVGYHNSGKTTLIEELVEFLSREGLRVGYIKHDPKNHGVTDKEGSDTDRLFKLTRRVVLLSSEKITLWDKRSYEPMEAVEEFFRDYDLVILEGFKSVEELPKIAVGDVSAQNILYRFNNGNLDELVKFLKEFISE